MAAEGESPTYYRLNDDGRLEDSKGALVQTFASYDHMKSVLGKYLKTLHAPTSSFGTARAQKLYHIVSKQVPLWMGGKQVLEERRYAKISADVSSVFHAKASARSSSGLLDTLVGMGTASRDVPCKCPSRIMYKMENKWYACINEHCRQFVEWLSINTQTVKTHCWDHLVPFPKGSNAYHLTVLCFGVNLRKLSYERGARQSPMSVNSLVSPNTESLRESTSATTSSSNGLDMLREVASASPPHPPSEAAESPSLNEVATQPSASATKKPQSKIGLTHQTACSRKRKCHYVKEPERNKMPCRRPVWLRHAGGDWVMVCAENFTVTAYAQSISFRSQIKNDVYEICVRLVSTETPPSNPNPVPLTAVIFRTRSICKGNENLNTLQERLFKILKFIHSPENL